MPVAVDWTLNSQPPRPRWGVHAPTMKAMATRNPIVVAPPPAQVVIPLAHRTAIRFAALVSPGEGVVTGQPIARSAAGEQLHASITGIVRALDRRAVAAPALAEADCVVIDRRPGEELFAGYTPVNDPVELPPESLRAGIASAGIVGLGGALFPTAQKLSSAGPIRALIVNGAECEPWITCDEMLLRERASQVIAGARIMMRALGAPRCVVVVETDMPEARVAVHDAIAAAGDDRIEMAVVTAKYPAGGERQLVELLSGMEVPAGGWPRDVGFVCQNAGTAAAVADFYLRGRPLISRVVTVTGRGITKPGNYEVRIGTPIRELIAFAGGYRNSPERLIMGGPMMGLALPSDELPVTQATNCIVAATSGEFAAPRMEMPCIRCGECVNVCPANLLPQELLIAAKQGDADGLGELGVLDCIECGCCDYVCPSYLRLTARFAAGKQLVHDRRSAARQAAVARQRFDAHAGRLLDRKERESREHEAQADSQAIRDLVDKIRGGEAPR
jgi:electron transport complex protein RnfC